MAFDDEYGKGLATYIETYPIQPMDLYNPLTTPYKIYPLLKNPSPTPSEDETVLEGLTSPQNREVSEKPEAQEKEAERADSSQRDATSESDPQNSSKTV